MDFKARYTNDRISEPDKIVVSNDAYLQAEMLDDLIKNLNALRVRSDG